MTHTDTDIDTDTDTDTDIEMVVVDILDAAEMAEICEYLADWISGAPPAVAASLARFGGPDAKAILLEALARLGDRLVRAVPSPKPTLVRSPAALAGGETLGVAQLLADLAVNGWPAHPEVAEAKADDCHRWAVRLLNTPAVLP